MQKRYILLSLALLAGPALSIAQTQAQTQPPSTSRPGWRRVDDPTAAAPMAQATPNPGPVAQEPAPPPAGSPPAYQGDPRDQYGNPVGRGPQAPPPNTQAPPDQPPQGAPPPPPPQLTIKPGTYITVRLNQPLSSDHNQAGDAFSATLVRPIVVDGYVIAQSGETLGGRVAEAQKAGRVEGVSRLAVQITDLTLVDGQNVPIHSQLISRNGPTSVGRDVAAVCGTTALGAAVGAAADWGRGAAIGAGAGAAVGLLGVLLTRGHPTVLYPEQVLTFRVEEPVTIATERAPQAFRWVEPEDYQQGLRASRPSSPRPPCGPYGCPPSMAYGGYPYAPYPYYPGFYGYPYWGPSFGFFYGPRFYGGRGFYRGWRR